jgi:hypothetical protein
LSAGSVIQVDAPVVSKSLGLTNTTGSNIKVTLSSNSVVKINTQDKVASSVGAAQVNIVGQTVAKLSSMRWMTWVGLLLMLFGGASAFYPPLRAIVGSATTSVFLIAGGLLLMILPVLVVGHEGIILAFIGGGIGLYWFGHRHSEMATKARVYKDFIDTDKDGVDDRDEPPKPTPTPEPPKPTPVAGPPPRAPG